MGPGHRTIGILLFDDVEELDAVGPWDVLAAWTGFFPEHGWRVTTFSRAGGYVRAAKGLGMVAAESVDTCPPLSIVVHPGGQGTRPQQGDLSHDVVTEVHAMIDPTTGEAG